MRKKLKTRLYPILDQLHSLEEKVTDCLDDARDYGSAKEEEQLQDGLGYLQDAIDSLENIE